MATENHQIDYSALFQSLPGRHIIMDVNDPVFTIVEENAAHEEVAMVKRADIVGKPFFEAFPDTSDYYKKHGVSEVTLSFRRVIETKKADSMSALKYDIRDASGNLTERWWQATHYPLIDSNGNVFGILQETDDITEKMKADSKLNETRYQLDEALAIGQIGTWRWDVANDVVIADKNLARMFGIPEDEAAAGLSLDTFTDAIYISDRPAVLKAIKIAVETRGAYEKEYRTISRDGTVRSVIARGKVRLDRNGDIESFSGVIFDITERKTAEDNLTFLAQASSTLSSSLDYEQSLKAITKMVVPTIADWCVVNLYDDTDTLTQVAIAGKDSKQVAWVKNYYRTRKECSIITSRFVDKVVEAQKAQFFPKITTTKSDSDHEVIEKLDISSAISVPLIVREKIIGVITVFSTEQKYSFTHNDLAMFEDLARRVSLAVTNAHFLRETKTQLVELEGLKQQLISANEELESRVKQRTTELMETNLNLERSNQELQDFAYVASHDLQEPLRKIQAFGTILEEEYGKALGDGSDYLKRMSGAAARMSTLIEDLLEFSRVTTHAKEPKKIDLQTIAAEVLEDLETSIADHKGTINVGELPSIYADPMQMRQLLQNLIGNALKFHRPDVPPIVTVNATLLLPEKEYYELRITDNGVGFDEKYLDRIFAVFQRLHGRDRYEGTGIGLAVCRKIVERHGGKITATSVPGEGSTFIITLPTKKPSKENS